MLQQEGTDVTDSQATPKNGGFFSIESERSRHSLFLNGQKMGVFATLEAAEAAANGIANRAVPQASLRFELNFKWTLSDLEIRGATLEPAGGKVAL